MSRKYFISGSGVNYQNLYSNHFSGTNEHVLIPDDDAFTFGTGPGGTDSPFSLSCWIKKEATHAAAMLCKGFSTPWIQEYFFMIISNQVYFYIVQQTIPPYRIGRTSTATVMPDGMHHHIMATYDGNKSSTGIKLYVDGVRVDTGNYNSGTYTGTGNTTAPLRIGVTNESGTSAQVQGKISHPAIFNKELSAAEVNEVYAAMMNDLRSTSVGSNLISAWHFPNGPSGHPTMVDYVNGRNGTMTNQEATDITTDVPTLRNYYSNNLDGTANEYVTFGDHAIHTFGDGTTDTPFSGSIWFKRNSAAANAYDVLIVKSGATTANREFDFFIYNNTLYIRLFKNSASDIYIGRTNVSLNIPTNTWYHAAFTYSGNGSASGLKLYLNGARVDTDDNNLGVYTAMSDTTAELQVGGIAGLSNGFDGKLAHPALWNKELSANEVGEVYGRMMNDLRTLPGASNLVFAAHFPGGQNDLPVWTDYINGHHGTMANQETEDINTDIPVFSNLHSVQFDGVNEYITCGNASKFAYEYANNFSFSVWVKFTAHANMAGIMTYNDSVATHDCGWYLVNHLGQFRFYITQPSSTVYIASNSNASSGLWMHVCCTVSASNVMNMYVDGVLQTASTTYSSIQYGTVNRHILKFGNYDIRWLNARIIHPAIFNKQLTAAEVQELFDKKMTDYRTLSFGQYLTGAWAFPTGQTGYPTFFDYKGNMHGTLINQESADIILDNPPL